MTGQKFYMRAVRDDGSHTFRGPWTHSHVMREMLAWKHAFPAYDITIHEATPEVRAEVHKWVKATKVDAFNRQSRYYPNGKVA